MFFLKQFLRHILGPFREYLPLTLQRRLFKCVTLKPEGKSRGRVLVSYAVTSAGLPDGDPLFRFHTGPWESACIVSIFRKFGFIVDVVHFNDTSFMPDKSYDVIFACTGELYRLTALGPRPAGQILKIWHPVVSFIPYNNARELERIEALKKRRPGALYTPKRQEPYEDKASKIGALADAIILIGNEWVKNTYPKVLHEKMSLITVTASPFGLSKRRGEYVPKEREFLWYFGVGAVRKGLDLLLEVFAKHPEWILNIVGPLSRENDFFKIYEEECKLLNIRYHGYLSPQSEEFARVTGRSFCFIAPTATESISTAAATMLQLGLYPLVSRDAGIDLPKGAGMYLEDCDLAEIEEKVKRVYEMPAERLEEGVAQTQAFALHEFSREKFRSTMEAFLERILKVRGLL